ncbi:MAG: TIM-barrel domain-containing protein [Bacteroidota bacterium]
MASRNSTAIRHLPEGYYPGDRLYCDRVPRHPLAGQNVLVKAEIDPTLAGNGVILRYSCNGHPGETRGRHVRDYHSTKSSIQPILGEAGALDYFLFELGRFDAGDEVVYEIVAGVEDRNAVSGPYRFVVDGLFQAAVDAVIHPTPDGAVVVFAGEAGCRPQMTMNIREGRLHLALSLAGRSVLPGESVAVLKRTDPATGVTIELRAAPFCLTVMDAEANILFSTPTGSPWWLWQGGPRGKARCFKVNLESRAEHYYGFGERFDAVDQNGLEPDICVVNQYTRQGARTYHPIPFFLTERGFGAFVASDRYLKFGLAPRLPGLLSMNAVVDPDDPELEMVFFFGTPKEIIRAFTFYTGQPVLPPTWAFGPWMSGNSWSTQRQIEEYLATTEKLDIPATVMVIEAWSDEATFYIFNGALYQPKPGGQAFSLGDFTFAADAKWPDPKGMVDKLHAHGMRLVLWQIPVLQGKNPQQQLDEEYAIANGFCAFNADGTPYRIPDGWFAGCIIIDFTNPAAREWWLAKRRYLLDELGVDGFKTDGGEHILDDTIRFYDGSDGAAMRNRYPRAYIQAYHEFLGEKRLTFSRAGFVGCHQYPMYWAGDQISTYAEFQSVLRAGLSLGLSGNAFWGFDIGGFAGDVPTADLYLRSVQMAAFCPVMQYHSDGPDNYNHRSPWHVAERTGDERVVSIYRFYAWLRMNLLPYIHRQAGMAVAHGEPLMRALCLDFPDDPVALKLEDEYMFGRDLLVAPVLSENARERRLYLPDGEWLDFWTLRPVPAGWHERYPCDLDLIPVFIRKGAVLPVNLGETFALGRPTGVKGMAYGRLCFLLTGDLEAPWVYDDGEGCHVLLAPGENGLTVEMSGVSEIFLIAGEEHSEWEAVGETAWHGCLSKMNVYRFGER